MWGAWRTHPDAGVALDEVAERAVPSVQQPDVVRERQQLPHGAAGDVQLLTCGTGDMTASGSAHSFPACPAVTRGKTSAIDDPGVLTDPPVPGADGIPVPGGPHVKFLPTAVALQLVEADDQVHALHSTHAPGADDSTCRLAWARESTVWLGMGAASRVPAGHSH